MQIKIPKECKEICHILKNKGYTAYLVGGAVRDHLMGKKVSDFDITTNARPEIIQKLFRRTVPTGIHHGTVTVLMGSHSFEITTFRAEGNYSNNRHPDEVFFSDHIEEDLERRDFTINAMAYDPLTHTLIDRHGGKKDLKSKVIRAIGNPEERFREDALRMMRCCRFSAQLDFSIDQRTFDDLVVHAKNLTEISKPRIGDEWRKIMSCALPSRGIIPMMTSGILKVILPELHRCADVSAGERHRYDLLGHLLKTTDYTPYDNLVLRFAALLHDCGKPDSIEGESNSVSFHGHEEHGAATSERLLRHYAFPNKFIDEVTHLIRNHSIIYTQEWTSAAVRRFIRRVGVEALKPLFLLRRADIWAAGGSIRPTPFIDELELRTTEAIAASNVFTIKDMAVNGRDILGETGLLPGPKVGKLLELLLEAVIEDPALNTREKLIELALNYKDKYFNEEFL